MHDDDHIAHVAAKPGDALFDVDEAIEHRSALICRSKKSPIFRHFLDSI